MNSALEPVNASLLLVDDDATFSMVLARALGKRGFTVQCASDVSQALELLRAHTPDYAVIDLNMPGDSGLVLIPQLKQANSQVQIVMLTGYASIATAVEAIKLGATHYLAKPADVTDIVTALSRDQGDAQIETRHQPHSVRRLEWEHIQAVLTAHDGNISATARALNMHRRTLQRKLFKRPVQEH
ncbi:MAG: response regulator transcription factor [Betaproteobacteria bacterium]|nr:response regulator transcription factor [Betaproteobacteria bacterium]